jgi:YVTN family beta-propeller protein
MPDLDAGLAGHAQGARCMSSSEMSPHPSARAPRRSALARLLALVMVVSACDGGVGPVPSRKCYPQDPSASVRTMLDGPAFGVAVSPSGVALVTQLDQDRLARFALPAAGVQSFIAVGSTPVRVEFNNGGTIAFVANLADATVGIVNVASGAQTAAVALRAAPISLAASPDGARLYVGTGADSVVVIDAGTRGIVTAIRLDGEINGLALHPGQPLLYASGRTSGLLWEISTRTHQVERTFVAGGVPQDIVVTPDGRRLYMADEAGPLQIWSLASGQRIGTVSGAQRGFGLALSPDAEQIYMTSALDGRMHVVDARDGSYLLGVSIGGTPRRVAFAPDCSVVVANEAGWVDYHR